MAESVSALARRRQRIDTLCAAALRALTGERDLHFRGGRLHRGGQRLPPWAPHLHPSIEDDDFDSFRGATDALALRLLHSDATLHRALAPADPLERALFDLLEQLRVESLAGDRWPGVRRNLRHRFEAWSRAYVASRLTEGRAGLGVFALAHAARARTTGEPVPHEAEDLIEGVRADFAHELGSHLAALRRTRGDQPGYAEHALVLAQAVAMRLRALREELGDDGPLDEARVGERVAFDLPGETEDSDGDGRTAAGPGAARDGAADGPPYRIYTGAYDREVAAATLVRAQRLREAREQLDRRVAAQGLNVARLARDLHRLLARPESPRWVDDQEEGRVDARRLAQLVASPTERRLFRREVREPLADAVVGFLIDCSGSMRAHAEAVATLVELFARALHRAGLSSEILGFTTSAWNGGRARRDWLAAGRPPLPGRLAERLHLVFKSGDTPWPRARRSLAALLEPQLFREGLDGEALEWAAARLAARSERRRLLIVVSDGCPMEAATTLANEGGYLAAHLARVAEAIEAQGAVELGAIGIGLDLSVSYGRCLQLDLDGGLANRAFGEVVALLAGGVPRPERLEEPA